MIFGKSSISYAFMHTNCLMKCFAHQLFDEMLYAKSMQLASYKVQFQPIFLEICFKEPVRLLSNEQVKPNPIQNATSQA